MRAKNHRWPPSTPQDLVLGEVDGERDLRGRADGADLGRFLLRIALGIHEIDDGLGARGSPIADAHLEDPNPAVHLVVGRLVQVDGRSPRRPTGGFLDHLAAELVVQPDQDRDREAVSQGFGGRGLYGERHRFGPGDVHAIARLETLDDLGVGGVQQSARVGRPVRSGEGHHLVDGVPAGDGHGSHPLPGSRGARQIPGCRHSRRFQRPVDGRLARRLQPQADTIVEGGRHAVANLDLFEPYGSGRHVQSHRDAPRPPDRHRAGGVVDGLNSSNERHLGARVLGLRCHDRRRRHQHSETHRTDKKLFRHGNSPFGAHESLQPGAPSTGRRGINAGHLGSSAAQPTPRALRVQERGRDQSFNSGGNACGTQAGGLGPPEWRAGAPTLRGIVGVLAAIVRRQDFLRDRLRPHRSELASLARKEAACSLKPCIPPSMIGSRP